MNRTRTSNAWLREHVTDCYVRRAKAEGYRSRAAYKLLAIDAKDHLIHPGDRIVDLGASPGGWCQVVARKLAGRGQIVAVDLLDMAPLAGVTFLQGDFREDQVLTQLQALLAGEKLALVLSDMSPNISGVALSDQARVMHLAELALDFADNWLKPDGALLVKVFQGHSYEQFVARMRQIFQQVAPRKPDASRDRSPEIYLLGRKLRR
ncbi:MAG TPA: RlmE family RNA methyltransferase [Accumulibacter sp.]|nr:RlmE family RNA methyltransferase [Accumulibacter sp.]HMW18009.1 RlmE family RNA methyltransferase [Accumulibacter sp.]HMX23324.1 RlmE family RNA methyltransferase [Accumulibacter sp.]HNC17597.1 RlmE family RNA methyltransferase [Accumulibacter sp.]HND80200.1 RlmE family RNA methyltransferase [Accumulibacter sp.]